MKVLHSSVSGKDIIEGKKGEIQMMKLVKKWTAVVLSITMVLGTMTVNPARAENDSAEVPEEEFYAAGAYPTDMSKISDDMKIDTLEEYYDVIAEEEQFNMLSDDGESGLQEELPDSVDLSTSEYFPAIGNQGAFESCVSFAQTYYQFTYEMNRKMKRPTTRENTLSPMFPYNLLSNDNGKKGTYAETIYSLLQSKGTIPWSYINYSDDIKSWFPTKEIWEEADNYRIEKYYFISSNLGGRGDEISSPKDSDLDIVKTALNRGDIVCASTFAGSWIEEEIGDNSPYTGEMIVTDVSGYEIGHRVTIVGYDDNIWIDINGDGEVQEAEKGAFKIANSWGDDWENSGFFWFAYDAVNSKSQVTGESHVSYPPYNNNCGLYDFTIIEVADYNSDSDIKLVYTLNTNSRKELVINVTAIDRETGNVYTQKATPYYVSDANSDSRDLSFNGTDENADGIMVMDLDTVVPGLTSENFNDYAWDVSFSEQKDDDYRTVIKDVKIVDYNTDEIYEFDTTYPQSINGSSVWFEYNPNAQGYDLEVTDISYINLETGQKNGRIEQGDRIRFESVIKNAGDKNIAKHQKLSVLFTAGQKIVYNGGVSIGTRINIKKGYSVIAMSGEDEGAITFSEPGTYSVTAWANYNNVLSEEYGGISAENNKKTSTIEVFPKEERLKVTSFTASNTEPESGETVTFNVSYKGQNAVRTKIDILSPRGMYLYRGEYVDGTQISYQFNENNSYYVQATVKDIITGEEVPAEQSLFISVKNKVTGYDFEVSSLTYYWTDTGITNKKVYVGDAIKLSAKVKNVGAVDAPDNQTMRISFQIGDNQENKVWNEEYTGKAGLAAGAGITLRAKSGGQQGNGNYIFDEPGTYTVTAWVNDTNELSGEAGGNTAANNKKTITIQVYDKESVTNIEDFEVDETDVLQGDTVYFAVPSFHASGAPMIRLDIYTEGGALYDRIAYHYGFNEYYCFEESGTYYVQAYMVDTGNGERGITSKIPVTVGVVDGYDLAVAGISYINVDTGQIDGGLKAGDRIKLRAKIENKGNTKAPDNTLMKVTYQVDYRKQTTTLYNDQFKNRSGLAAGGSFRLNSNKGGADDDGIYTLTENGTYTFTVSVNDDNAFPDEVCGNGAKNNQRTITVRVAEPEKKIRLNSFEASAEEVFEGETVDFYAEVYNANTLKTKLHIYGMNGVIYHGSYVLGEQAEYRFEQEGTYYIQATIVDPVTGEEVNTGFITVVVKRRED